MAKKYLEIYNKLLSDIQSHIFQNGEKLPSETQMIETYGVSRQTVRRVLAMLEKDGLVRKSQGSGSFVQYAETVQHAERVAVIFYDMDISVFPVAARRFDEILFQHGYSTAFYTTVGSDCKERTILKHLLVTPVDGIVMCSGFSHPTCNNMDLVLELRKQGTKIVFFESWYGNPEFSDAPIISSENYLAPYLITDFLIRQGYNRIGTFRIPFSLVFASRFSGIYNALLCNGVATDPEDSFLFDVIDNVPMFETPEFIDNLLSRDAFICPNSWTFDPLVKLLQKFGTGNLRTIVVFDEVPVPQIDGIDFIILQYDINALATLCAEKLLDLINGRDVKSVQLPWRISASTTAKNLPTNFERN